MDIFCMYSIHVFCMDPPQPAAPSHLSVSPTRTSSLRGNQSPGDGSESRNSSGKSWFFKGEEWWFNGE